MSEERRLRRALEVARKRNGDVLQAIVDLANHYRERKAWEPLIALTDERYAAERAIFGAGLSLVYLADTLLDAGRGEEAVALLERTRRDFEADRVTDEFKLRTLWSTTTTVMQRLGRLDDAIAACRRAVEIAHEAGPQYSDYWEMHAFLADVVQFGKRDAAGCVPERTALWQHFRRVLERGELAYNATIVHVQNAARLGHALRELERWAEARAIYEPLIADVTAASVLGPGSIERPTLMLDLADCHAALGDRGAARALAAHALELLAPHGDAALSERARARLA